MNSIFGGGTLKKKGDKFILLFQLSPRESLNGNVICLFFNTTQKKLLLGPGGPGGSVCLVRTYISPVGPNGIRSGPKPSSPFPGTGLQTPSTGKRRMFHQGMTKKKKPPAICSIPLGPTTCGDREKRPWFNQHLLLLFCAL